MYKYEKLQKQLTFIQVALLCYNTDNAKRDRCSASPWNKPLKFSSARKTRL